MEAGAEEGSGLIVISPKFTELLLGALLPLDFAYSDEFVVDHAFSVPLNFMRPQGDLPIVPLFLNFLAPPVPPARRYLKLGKIVRRIIEEYPEDLRVAVICTGHMTNGVGGPYMMRHTQRPEGEWDKTVNAAMLANEFVYLN